jgi:hypothetical protein
MLICFPVSVLIGRVIGLCEWERERAEPANSGDNIISFEGTNTTTTQQSSKVCLHTLPIVEKAKEKEDETHCQGGKNQTKEATQNGT